MCPSVNKLCIDIEIDEPYVGSTGEPIHTINCNDEDRDHFFKKYNWLVIRFTERQVILQSESCCKQIAQTIDENLKTNLYSSKFMQYDNLTEEKRWTKADAFEMARTKYRDSYLGHAIF